MFLEMTDVGQMWWNGTVTAGLRPITATPERVTNIIFIEAKLYKNYEIQMCFHFVLPFDLLMVVIQNHKHNMNSFWHEAGWINLYG